MVNQWREKMIEQLLFTITMVTYWLREGCTEGYTWASKKERKTIYEI